MKDISVIIPVYGVEAYIEECLQSVMAQGGIDGLNVECLVVDDCGPDRSMEIARKVIESYNGPIEFRIITREINGGLSAARNSGIREARGEYIFFLDSDDLLTSHCFSVLWAEVNKHSGVDMVFGQTVCFPDEKVHSGYLNLRKCGALEYDCDCRRMRTAYLSLPEIACNRLLRTSWLKKNDLFFQEGKLNEDTIWQIQAYPFVRSYAAVMTGEATYLYRQRTGSITNVDDVERRFERKSKIYLDAARSMAVWDAPFFYFICDYLLSMKFATKELDINNSHRIFRRDVAALRACSAATAIHRIVLDYLKLPRPWMRVVIVQWIVKLIR